MKTEKYLTKHDKIKDCIMYGICGCVVFALVLFMVEFVIYEKNVDLILQIIQETAKWSAIAFPVIIVFFTIRAFYNSEMVEFQDEGLCLYRFCFSKEPYEKIPYGKITECVVSKGLWIRNAKYIHGRKIFIYSKALLLKEFQLNKKIIVQLFLKLGEHKFRVVGNNRYLKTINKFFDIEFEKLSYEQQLVLAKRLCQATKSHEQSGEKLLKKKGLL